MTCRQAALAVALLAAVMPSPARAQGATSVAAAATGAPEPGAAPAEVPDPGKPIIELVTMGVGSLLWERHGHIALCVRYDDPREDRCYNYGTAEFHRPLQMAWGFLRAEGNFWVDKSPPSRMLYIYTVADRTVWTQALPLSASQKQRMLAKLESDILPANRYYAYDHFWDNCTTRVRDIIDDVTGGALSKMREPTDGKTFRDLARVGFFGMPLPLLITDFAMGRVTDRVPTYYERMFLPQYLREAVATLWHVAPVAIYERRGPPPPADAPSGRGLFALVILALTSPAWIARAMGRLPRLGLAVAIVPYALLGAALTFLAIISPLPYIRWNETCLVLVPLDLAVVVLSAERARLYALARLAMLGAVGALGLVGVLTQPLLAELLWPAIPLAVVGLWPARARAVHAGDAAGKRGRAGAR